MTVLCTCSCCPQCSWRPANSCSAVRSRPPLGRKWFWLSGCAWKNAISPHTEASPQVRIPFKTSPTMQQRAKGAYRYKRSVPIHAPCLICHWELRGLQGQGAAVDRIPHQHRDHWFLLCTGQCWVLRSIKGEPAVEDEQWPSRPDPVWGPEAVVCGQLEALRCAQH